jgi:hypothetical protein
MERNMRKLLSTTLLAALAASLIACGGDDAFKTPAAPNEPGAEVASISVLASSPQLLSDDSAPVTITVRAVNDSNQAMADVPIAIQASSGVLQDIEAITNASGVATAVLHNSGDYSNRDITVTASAGDVSDSVVVSVTGTRLDAPAAVQIVLGSETDSTVTLLDAGGQGIPGETIAISSEDGNSLSATELTTDVNGQVVVTITGSVAGTDSITFSALGLTATQSVSVSNDSFAFVTPSVNEEILLDDVSTGGVENAEVVRVDWSLNGTAQANEDVNFATTRGTLYEYSGGCTTTVLNSSVQTDGSGSARACIAATNAGPAIITASTADSTVAQRAIEFVASTPDTMNLQASPTTVQTAGQSTITAVVRDAANNLVKNKTVVFTLTDTTGGTLSVGAATTNSQGRAQTIYTASETTSASNGVEIDATVQGTSVTASTTLTVAQRELFISLGTGNDIAESTNLAQYIVPYSIQVTDANGAGVANTSLTVRVLSLWYGTGGRVWNGSFWEADYVDACLDEDLLLGAGTGYRNGILDPGEDFNGTTRLEAGNIATVTPSVVTTDANGFADIEVVYPQEYAYWVKVELSALTSVQGTESIRSVTFQLPGLADDFDDEDESPPGPTSPFGTADYGCPDPATFP